MLTGEIKQFKEYSEFKTLKDFNNQIEMFLAEHKKEFTPTEYILFRRLTKFAAKVYGVATVSIKKFLKGVKEKDVKVGASESTFHRMKRKAIKLGILEVKVTSRKNGTQSTNLWIFKQLQTIDTPKTECEQAEPAPLKGKVFKQLTPLKTNNLFKTNNNKYINKRKEHRFDYTYTASYIPKEFVQAIKPFFDDAATIEDFWKSVFLDTRRIKHIVGSEIITYTAIDAFKQSIRGYKQGKVKTTLIRYFTGIFKKLMDQAYFDLPLAP
jgi:hypothetical protein